LGEGGFGKVYACWDSVKQEVIACKFISKAKIMEKIGKSNNKGLTKDFYIKSLQNEANLM
jgi:serine/threonine protein kinase